MTYSGGRVSVFSWDTFALPEVSISVVISPIRLLELLRNSILFETFCSDPADTNWKPHVSSETVAWRRFPRAVSVKTIVEHNLFRNHRSSCPIMIIHGLDSLMNHLE